MCIRIGSAKQLQILLKRYLHKRAFRFRVLSCRVKKILIDNGIFISFAKPSDKILLSQSAGTFLYLLSWLSAFLIIRNFWAQLLCFLQSNLLNFFMNYPKLWYEWAMAFPWIGYWQWQAVIFKNTVMGVQASRYTCLWSALEVWGAGCGKMEDGYGKMGDGRWMWEMGDGALLWLLDTPSCGRRSEWGCWMMDDGWWCVIVASRYAFLWLALELGGTLVGSRCLFEKSCWFYKGHHLIIHWEI